MIKYLKVSKVAIAIVFVLLCALFLCGCNSDAKGVQTNQAVSDNIDDNVSFGKKYFFLSNESYVSKEYYLFNKDGSAIYHHTIEENGKITFQSVINFKWEYTGNGSFLLFHNGTKILNGQQDDVTGFCRTMRVTKNAMYWEAFEPSAYFVCEDFVQQIPNYAKFVK